MNGNYEYVYSKNISADTLYKFTLTFDGHSIKLYKNGVLEDTNTPGGNYTYPKQTLLNFGG